MTIYCLQQSQDDAMADEEVNEAMEDCKDSMFDDCGKFNYSYLSVPPNGCCRKAQFASVLINLSLLLFIMLPN